MTDHRQLYKEACTEIGDLRAKVQFLLDFFVSSKDGRFAFPDGDTWDCPTPEARKNTLTRMDED